MHQLKWLCFVLIGSLKKNCIDGKSVMPLPKMWQHKRFSAYINHTDKTIVPVKLVQLKGASSGQGMMRLP